MNLLFFLAGGIVCFVLFTVINLPYFRRLRKKHRAEIEENPDKKFGATKVIVFSILFTYYVAFAIGVYVVLLVDSGELQTLLSFVGGATIFAVAFYCWKAKAENLEKIKSRLSSEEDLEIFAGMSSQ